MTRAPLVALAILLAGCGSSDSGGAGDVAGPVVRHVRAVSEGHFDAACAELAPAAQRDVIAFVARAAPSPPGSCAAAYGLLQTIGSLDLARSGVMDRSRANEATAPDVSVLEVKGDHARARVAGSRKSVPLERSGGGWKIARLDFSDVP
jgi:hypothetical protein